MISSGKLQGTWFYSREGGGQFQWGSDCLWEGKRALSDDLWCPGLYSGLIQKEIENFKMLWCWGQWILLDMYMHCGSAKLKIELDMNFRNEIIFIFGRKKLSFN